MILDKKLKPCPLCGAKAFVSHDVVDGFTFGWSVGCPRACIADGIHGFNDSETFRQAKLTMFHFPSKEAAIKAWNKRCEEGGTENDR